jgi:hypothetical protein
MKTTILALAFLTTFSAFANTTTYSNNQGCTVEVESRKNGVIYYVSKGNKNEVVGVTNDLTSGTFVYCDDSVLHINSFEGKKGIGILMSCSEHQNGHAVTRGRVDIDIMGGELTKIAIDGQVKKLLGWKQDTKIECLNLVKK